MKAVIDKVIDFINNKILFILVGTCCIIFLSNGVFDNSFTNSPFWDSLDASVTILTVVYLYFNYRYNINKEIAENKIIDIFILSIDDKKKYKLNLNIPRKNITRSEIQGLLSAFQKDISKRYSISYTSSTKYINNIYEVQTNKNNKIIIELDEKELNLFDLSKTIEIKGI